MSGNDWLAERFETHRAHLRAVAYRMLGSSTEADDAVQEAWFRLSRTDTTDVENLGGWLTTVVARVSLDMLRARTSRREEALGDAETEPIVSRAAADDPEREAVLADSVGLALLVVLDTLTPAERLAFVLHDMFAVPFDEIAPIVDRTPTAARQLASRARRRVQGASPASTPDLSQRQAIVDAFLAAARSGDFAGLVALLAPDAVVRADATAVAIGAAPEVVGQEAVAGLFSGGARVAFPALVDGAAGLVWMHRGRPRVVFDFTIVDGQISAIDLVADPERLREMTVVRLPARDSGRR